MDKYDYKCVNGHDLCYGIGDPDCPYCERIMPESNIDRLKKRLANDIENGLVDMHVTWGPAAVNMTPEERAGYILEIMDAPKTPVNIKDIDGPITGLNKMTIEEFIRSRDEILHECPTEGQQDTSEGD